MDVVLLIHLLKLRLHQVLVFIYLFNNPFNKIYCDSEGIQYSLIIIIWIIFKLGITQGNNKGFAFPNGLEISWTFLFHVSKTLTTKTLWFGGNSVLIAIPSILLPFILALELWRTGLLSVLVKSFRIGILHKLFELPCDVGFHLRIFIIGRLINVTAFGL